MNQSGDHSSISPKWPTHQDAGQMFTEAAIDRAFDLTQAPSPPPKATDRPHRQSNARSLPPLS
ncbi:MAG: hypothetical protein HC860_01995 [Alkalinema sp. RU_4_3]|nr:hypothetical protein [Alkalinema sp. RU_4_3]